MHGQPQGPRQGHPQAQMQGQPRMQQQQFAGQQQVRLPPGVPPQQFEHFQGQNPQHQQQFQQRGGHGQGVPVQHLPPGVPPPQQAQGQRQFQQHQPTGIMNAPPPPPPGERGDEFGGSIMDDAPGVAMEYKVRPIISIYSSVLLICTFLL